MGKIASNQGAAQAAVSGISNVSVSGGAKCQLGKSNLSGMKKGAQVSNQLVANVSKMVECVNNQANKFPKLATVIAARDSGTRFK